MEKEKINFQEFKNTYFKKVGKKRYQNILGISIYTAKQILQKYYQLVESHK